MTTLRYCLFALAVLALYFAGLTAATSTACLSCITGQLP